MTCKKWRSTCTTLRAAVGASNLLCRISIQLSNSRSRCKVVLKVNYFPLSTWENKSLASSLACLVGHQVSLARSIHQEAPSTCSRSIKCVPVRVMGLPSSKRVVIESQDQRFSCSLQGCDRMILFSRSRKGPPLCVFRVTLHCNVSRQGWCVCVCSEISRVT